MTISIIFNKDLLLWFIWAYIVLSGFSYLWDAITKDDEKISRLVAGVVCFIVAILVMIL